MDPLTALLPLIPPIDIDAKRVVAAGPIAPVLAPAAVYPVEQQADWLLADPDTPLADQIRLALASNLAPVAWHILAQQPGSVVREPGVRGVLEQWTSGRREAWHLPDGDRRMVIVGDTDGLTNVDIGNLIAGLDSANEVVAALPGPRWIGPVILVIGGHDHPALPARAQQSARAALPAFRIAPQRTGIEQRAAVAAQAARVYLTLSQPPATGWPTWLVDGIAGVAAARARGQGPSPRRMLRIRQQAGPSAIRSVLAGHTQDAELATAICAPLCHRLRSHRLGELLGSLRGSGDSLAAIAISYGFDLDHLVTRP